MRLLLMTIRYQCLAVMFSFTVAANIATSTELLVINVNLLLTLLLLSIIKYFTILMKATHNSLMADKPMAFFKLEFRHEAPQWNGEPGKTPLSKDMSALTMAPSLRTVSATCNVRRHHCSLLVQPVMLHNVIVIFCIADIWNSRDHQSVKDQSRIFSWLC